MEERTQEPPIEPPQGEEGRRKKEREDAERERRVGGLFCAEVMPYPSA
jgi:hypothetical protein